MKKIKYHFSWHKNQDLEGEMRFQNFDISSRCRNSDSPNKVMFYLQEKPLMFEGCEVGLCDWEYLKNKFSNVLSECDPNFCSNENGSSTNRAWSSIIVLIPTIVLVAFRANLGVWNSLFMNVI